MAEEEEDRIWEQAVLCGVNLLEKGCAQGGEDGEVRQQGEKGTTTTGAVAICYSRAYASLSQLLVRERAAMEGGVEELTRAKGVIWLTAQIISDHNSALYTAWQWRRDALRRMGKGVDMEDSMWEDELAFAGMIAETNQKNYQVFHHRQLVLEMSARTAYAPAARVEMDFTAKMLESDAKNYHVWQHRLWVVRTFRLWEEEKQFTAELIARDYANNSAFNQRHQVMTALEMRNGDEDRKWVAQLLQDHPRNAAALAYAGIQGIDSVDGDFDEKIRQLTTENPCTYAYAVTSVAAMSQGDYDAQ